MAVEEFSDEHAARDIAAVRLHAVRSHQHDVGGPWKRLHDPADRVVHCAHHPIVVAASTSTSVP